MLAFGAGHPKSNTNSTCVLIDSVADGQRLLLTSSQRLLPPHLCRTGLKGKPMLFDTIPNSVSILQSQS